VSENTETHESQILSVLRNGGRRVDVQGRHKRRLRGVEDLVETPTCFRFDMFNTVVQMESATALRTGCPGDEDRHVTSWA
jgi:hypothetical protein